MLMPDPPEPIEILRDPATSYVVHALIEVVTKATFHSFGDFLTPTVLGYSGQVTTGKVIVDTPAFVGVDLGPILFISKQLGAPVTVVGFTVSAVYDDGQILLGNGRLAIPVELGPNLPNLQLSPRLAAQAIPAGIDVGS